MNIEEVREYCLSLPLVTEDMAFGEDHLLFRVCDKIFGCLSLHGDDNFTVKCQPEYAVELRDTYEDIAPAFHWNKKYWIQMRLQGSLQPEFIHSLIRNSYSEVVSKLPRRIKTEHPELSLIAR